MALSANVKKNIIGKKNQSVKNFVACNGLLVNFDALKQFAIFRRFVKQQTSDSVNGHHFEKARNKIRINVTNHKIWIFVLEYLNPFTTNT